MMRDVRENWKWISGKNWASIAHSIFSQLKQFSGEVNLFCQVAISLAKQLSRGTPTRTHSYAHHQLLAPENLETS